ncbi:hypothetical protein [Enterobacter cloacae]|nr:hypothetical protein [Enterobacter cloacae]MCL8174862.1 hypothetical protein [Enterobacter cloacae]
MSRRHIFTERQRAALFDLPTDELSLLKFYTALLQIVGGDKLIIPFC